MRNFRRLIVSAIVAMVAISCQQIGESNLLVGSKVRFTADTEGTSRTTLGENYSVVWSEGDQIQMFGVMADLSLSPICNNMSWLVAQEQRMAFLKASWIEPMTVTMRSIPFRCLMESMHRGNLQCNSLPTEYLRSVIS